MPLIQTSPWSDAANVGSSLGHTIAQLLIQLPAIRAKEANDRELLGLKQSELGIERDKLTAQIPHFQSLAAAENARAGLYGEEQRGKQQDRENRPKIADAMSRFASDPQQGLSDLAGALGLVGNNPQQMMGGVRNAMGLANLNPTDPAVALELAGGNPMHIPANVPHNIGTGQVAVNPQTGAPIGVGPMNAAQGHQITLPPGVSMGTNVVSGLPPAPHATANAPFGFPASVVDTVIKNALDPLTIGTNNPMTLVSNRMSQLKATSQALGLQPLLTTDPAQSSPVQNLNPTQSQGQSPYVATAVHNDGKTRIGLVRGPKGMQWVPIR